MPSAIEHIFQLCKHSESKIRIDNFLEELTSLVRNTVHSEYCLAALYDKKKKELLYHVGFGPKGILAKDIIQEFNRTKIKTRPSIFSSDKSKPVNLKAKDISNETKDYLKERIKISVKSILSAPLQSRGEFLGLLEVINKKKGNYFSKYDEKLLCIFAIHAAKTIDNVRLHDENLAKERLSKLGHSIINSAHGLKNILNNMDGGTYIVEHGALTKNMSEVNKGWDILKRNSNRLRELVLDILLFSRPKKPEYIPSDINKICLDLNDLIWQTAKENNVNIKLDLSPAVKLFCLDPKGIFRCILNLVSNAVNACQLKGGGDVIIKTSLDSNGNLTISVTDNGTGISKDNLDHIFDVFFTTKGSKGTGLGLPVTKKIISEHFGTIDVESEIDIGTKFTITIPKNDFKEC